MKKAILTLFILTTASVGFAGEENCKIMIRTKIYNGNNVKNVLDIDQIVAGSYEECRKIASDKVEEKRVVLEDRGNVNATIGYRDLAVE